MHDISNEEKNEWKRFADILADGNLTRLIKQAVRRYATDRLQVLEQLKDFGIDVDDEEVQDIMVEAIGVFQKVEKKIVGGK